MVKAIRFYEPGGPEVLRWEDVDIGHPGRDQVRLRQTMIGLNYIDTYHRSGLYPLPMPSGIGMEAVGVVEATGPDAIKFSPGDRVAYATGLPGSYAETRIIEADKLVFVPQDIDDATAAAMMLKGLTAQYLIKQTYPVGAGNTILIHAAAGGVGLIVCQWAKSLGATVIGTVGNDSKAELARENGCDYSIIYSREDFAARVNEITNGSKVDVVYDSVGQSTFAASLECLRPRGTMVSFGQASGPIPPVDLGIFAQKGSLFFTRPTLFSYADTPERLAAMSRDLFAVVKSGAVKINIDQSFPLHQARKAHEALEARHTTGSTILTV